MFTCLGFGISESRIQSSRLLAAGLGFGGSRLRVRNFGWQ